MNITIIGTGFVGVVSSAVFASFGHQVIGLDVDDKKIASLKKGRVPFYEPNLEALLTEQQKINNLSFTTDYQQAITKADLIIIAVGTPSAPDGQADLKFVLASANSLAPHLKENAIVAVKSTVPPGTLDKIKKIIDQHTKVNYYLASLPEFLREGSAVSDTLHPDRVVIGATDQYVFDKLEELHQPFKAPIIKISPESAQMTKYAANSYLATRITFINQMANLCEKNGADVQEIVGAIGLDQRIGQHYWYPGFGYGGSCFPKDVSELAAYSRAMGEANNLFNKVHQLNQDRIPQLMKKYGQKIGGWSDKTVAVLGLSFKPNTDDMREAPCLSVVPYLTKAGATVTGFDPKAKWQQKQAGFTQKKSLETAVEAVDVIMVLVEWPELVSFNYSQVKADKQQWFIDGRNQFEPQKIHQWGYTYLGVGRGST